MTITIEEFRKLGKKKAVRGRGRTSGRQQEMNGFERSYSEILTARQIAGEIADWAFEPFNLRLAKNTFYCPDFLVVLPDGLMQVVEVKGHWEDDARVKIKVAAEKFPWFEFVAVTKRPKKHGGGWQEERFSA